MAGPTRIQTRSRPTKRPQATGTWSTGGGIFTMDKSRSHMPKLDERGYPQYGGVLSPTHVQVTEIA